ncbi:MAG: AAA family ATPase [Phenylobacterium sp.]|uniref:AAA family ATPase n=1 Tax=Phenylobacterium sp. TaxID=1871053 RepID=UPI0025F71043|nr:AAA family ATPase [Phenylobacterium sp.]MCG9915438.1 AAA family ATPase [Phenylobacterium sp.]
MLFPTFEQWVGVQMERGSIHLPASEDDRRGWRARYERDRKAALPFALEWGHEMPIEQDEWLIEGLVPRKAYGFIYGYRGAGKSFQVVDMAYRGAVGPDYMGHRIGQPFGSIIFVGEKRSRFAKRLLAWIKANGHAGRDLAVMVVDGVPDLTDEKAVKTLISFLNEEARPHFDAMGVPLEAIFIDTLARAIGGGGVSDASVANRTIHSVSQIIDCANVTVMLVAHVAKLQSGRRGDASVKGAGEWEDAADFILRLERTSGSPVRTITNTKQSDAPEAATLAFELEPIELTAPNGVAVSSCVVRQVPVPARPKTNGGSVARQPHPDAPLVLAAIRASVPAAADHQSAERVVSVGALRASLIERGYRADLRPPSSDAEALRTWQATTRKSVDRAIASLAEQKLVRRLGDQIWLLPTEGSA